MSTSCVRVRVMCMHDYWEGKRGRGRGGKEGEADHGHVTEAADDEEREEEEEDEENDGKTPVRVVVHARRRHLVAGANGLLDVLKAQRLGAERAPRNLSPRVRIRRSTCTGPRLQACAHLKGPIPLLAVGPVDADAAVAALARADVVRLRSRRRRQDEHRLERQHSRPAGGVTPR